MIKSCFLWEIRQVGKTYAEVVRNIRRLGVNRIEVKAADGTKAFKEPAWCSFGLSQNAAYELINLLHYHGIQVYGWGFNYLADPAGEGDIAAQQAVGLKLDGWIFDVEDQAFGRWDSAARMERMLQRFRDLAPGVDAGFSAFPCWHNPAPPFQAWKKKDVYQAAAQAVDFWQPQAYWGHKWGTTAEQLPVDAIKQHREIKDLPVIPAGRGWSDGAGKVTPALVEAFANASLREGAIGLSWWVLHLVLGDPLIEAAISQLYERA